MIKGRGRPAAGAAPASGWQRAASMLGRRRRLPRVSPRHLPRRSPLHPVNGQLPAGIDSSTVDDIRRELSQVCRAVNDLLGKLDKVASAASAAGGASAGAGGSSGSGDTLAGAFGSRAGNSGSGNSGNGLTSPAQLRADSKGAARGREEENRAG